MRKNIRKELANKAIQNMPYTQEDIENIAAIKRVLLDDNPPTVPIFENLLDHLTRRMQSGHSKNS